MADEIVNKFVSAGLMRREYDRVKLHLTVMNSLFRKKDASDGNENSLEDPLATYDRRQNGPSSRLSSRETIDAREVLKLFQNRHFAQTEINELHLSQMKAGRRTKENYYFPSAIVQLTDCG